MSSEKIKNVAEKCHEQLKHPKLQPIRNYLHGRLITDEMIDIYKLGYGEFYGSRWITIPIADANDEYLFMKLRKDPFQNNSNNKYMFYPQQVESAIYGIKNFLTDSTIVVCEGEFDRIILESMGVPAICSTVGATAFKKDWLEAFENCRKVYIVFDNDEAGLTGSDKLGKMILEKYSNIKVFNCILPEELGEGGDITDFAKLQGGEIDIDDLFYEKSIMVHPALKKESNHKKYNNERTFDSNEITQEDVDKASSTDCSQFLDIVKEGYDKSWARCILPNHQDNTPSLCAYKAELGYYCYSCSNGGDAIDLVQRLYNLDFIEAVKFINS